MDALGEHDSAHHRCISRLPVLCLPVGFDQRVSGTLEVDVGSSELGDLFWAPFQGAAMSAASLQRLHLPAWPSRALSSSCQSWMWVFALRALALLSLAPTFTGHPG